MKLRKIISAFLALGIVATATPAFAADSDLFQIGTPYDITAGESTDALVAGHVIALPIDVDSTTDSLTNFQIEIKYDSNIVTPGYDTSDADDAFFDAVDSIVGSSAYATDEVTLQYINAMGTKRGSKFTAAGSAVFNPARTADSVEYGWYNTGTKSVNASTPEAYIIFTVKTSTDADALNTEVFKVGSTCLLADTVNNKAEVTNVTNTVNKINACAAAFQVDVDNDALADSGFWIQKLYAKVGDTTQDLTICNNAEGTATYSFPTRILTNTTGNDDLTVDIYATVTTDEAGTENAADVKVGTFNLTADGTATNYGTATTITGIDK